MAKNYYDILGVSKTAPESEIKKAYKKKAMEYHPDKNAWDKKAEAKFKEVNEAYQTLSDSTKKKNYDQFWSSEDNPFGGMWWNSSRWRTTENSSGFDFTDIFSQFGWETRGWNVEFDIGDMFGGGWSRRNAHTWKQYRDEPSREEIVPNLDVTETIEIPFFEFLYDTSVNIRTVYGKNLTLKVKAGTKPGTKYKISGKWRSMDGNIGDMYVIVDAKMPKEIPENIRSMLEAIRYQI